MTIGSLVTQLPPPCQVLEGMTIGSLVTQLPPPCQVLEGMTIEGTPIFNKLAVEDQTKFMNSLTVKHLEAWPSS